MRVKFPILTLIVSRLLFPPPSPLPKIWIPRLDSQQLSLQSRSSFSLSLSLYPCHGRRSRPRARLQRGSTTSRLSHLVLSCPFALHSAALQLLRRAEPPRRRGSTASLGVPPGSPHQRRWSQLGYNHQGRLGPQGSSVLGAFQPRSAISHRRRDRRRRRRV